MSQIQDSCLSLNECFCPHVFFMGAALLAGKYAIRYFPNTSSGGLFLTAGLASITLCFYDVSFYETQLSYSQKLFAKTIAIALATLGTNLVARSLKGRVNISWEAAGKFALVEFIIIAVFSYTPGKPPGPSREELLKQAKEKRLNEQIKFIDIDFLAQFAVQDIKQIEEEDLKAAHRIMKVQKETLSTKFSQQQLSAFNDSFKKYHLEEITFS